MGEERSPARIIVADDHALMRSAFVSILSYGRNLEVVGEAEDGREAVALCERLRPDLVLMDISMPEMDGYAATAQIRHLEEDEERHTPIIAMTAHAMQGDREKAIDAGMDDYVPKPVKVDQLAAVLGRWVPEKETHESGASQENDIVVDEGPEEEDLPLDGAVLEGLRELGGLEMFSELAEVFLEDADSRLAALREAVEGGDARSVELIAHALKGSSGNMGAKRMTEICAELQDAGTAGDLSGTPELLDRLEAEFDRARQALNAELPR